MPAQLLYTFKDAIDHALTYLGADVTAQAVRDARTAVRMAYRNLANAHNWSCYYQRGRLNTVAPQTDGTIAYTNSTRTVTLSDATWPDWAAYGTLVIGGITYEVAERVSNATLTLSANSNPGADVAAGTAYTLLRDTYPMPVDFQSSDRMLNVTQSTWLMYTHPREWLERQRINIITAQPRIYSFTADPNYMGMLAVRFFPAPDAAYQFDYLYQRQPRPLVVEEYKTGTIATSSGSTSVVGTGTSWTSSLIGSVFRMARDTVNYPTGLDGATPYAYERVILDVPNATTLTLDGSIPETVTRAKYVVSDPVDIEIGAMLTVFQRGIEREVALSKRMKDKADAVSLYDRELRYAQQADSRSFERRAAGMQPFYRERLANMPRGVDIE